MATSTEYSLALKSRAIKDFVLSNARSPNKQELLDLMSTYRKDYPNLDSVGFVGLDISKPDYHGVSSASAENQNREAFTEDLLVISDKLDRLTTTLESSFRGIVSTSGRTLKRLKATESRLDNLILLNSNVDSFVYGFEETLDEQTYIDIENSTTEVEAGYVTMGRNGYSPLELSDVRIGLDVTAEKSIVSFKQVGTIESLKKTDGSFWDTMVYTNYRTGRVTLLLNLELDEPAYISDFRFVSNPINGNNLTTYTVMYSLDGSAYTALLPAEQAVAAGENSISVGVDAVKKIRLALSKSAADDIVSSGKQNIYIFSLDSVFLFSDGYSSDLESILYAGPYEIYDELGEPVYFTKATLTSCIAAPENTSIDFFLSQDNSTWLPVSTNSNASPVVTFGSSNMDGTYSTIDSSQPVTAVVDLSAESVKAHHGSEAYLNLYIPEANVSEVSLNTLIIKRNTLDTNEIFGAPAGWVFDPTTNQYTTTVYVQSGGGRSIDFGFAGVKLNGRQVSGLVWIPPGYSTVSIDDANWIDVESGLTSIKSLKTKDPLYPYNHKLLVEGYTYGAGFREQRVYSGVDEYFGSLLQYVPPELFLHNSNKNNYSIYTIDDQSGDLSFRVKTNKSDASWKQERFSVEYLVQSSDSNQLYVKAILKSSNTEVSPKLDSFKVRVV